MRALIPLLLLAFPAAAQPLPAAVLAPDHLAALPPHQLTLLAGAPPSAHLFAGPLLWDVLTSSGAVDPARHADAVRQWLELRAADGYTAVVALGEISPEFEGKPAILATRMDGAPLERPRLVLPGDRRAGRSARDVVAISLESLPRR